ncbi:uncharacterized protein LOC132558913 [Ylistrum balloti]|uniref:uncharacterized protein LOC132558913 n=1 Tax=Ylistrum balloti TaxID=509963 RepID=UPI002905E429|nr:uncharacterized protein LOC132558913 [Ylistrum balloti]
MGADTYLPYRLENMTDLYCPDSCGQDTECCVCENKRGWQLEGQVVDLHVRYTDIRGSSIVYIHWDDSTHNYTRLSHVNGRLRKLPANICTFPSTVELELDNNEIENLDGIGCLVNLDSLYLNDNNLEIIRNTTFRNLTSLRNLYLSNNKIVSIDPNSFSLCCGQYILNVDISRNQIESIDVTNYALKTFCRLSISDNKKNMKTSNQLGFKIMPDEKFGTGGTIDFENCSLQSFFNYSDFGLDSWNKLYKNLDISVSFTSDALTCDCNMAELLSGDIGNIKKFWKQAEEYICERPPELNGTKLTDIYVTYPEKQDLLICNITEYCPRKCHCYNQPSHDRVVADCQGQGLTTMPKHLPWGNGDRLKLLFAGNDIQHLEERPYLGRISELDLSGNRLSHISETAASVLPNDARLNATGNKLTSLPRHFQNRSPATLVLGHVLLSCSCEDLWTRSWLSFRRYEDSPTSYICENLGGKVITEADFSSLKCYPDTSNINIILGSLAALLAIIVVIILARVLCYPEIYVIYRRKLRRVKQSQGFKYDAYVSFYDEDTLQRKWVIRNLAKHMEKRGYTLFIPVRDASIAECREEYIRSTIGRCKHFIIILSEKYFKSSDQGETTQLVFTQFEFNNMWKVYQNDMRRNLVIINYDNLSVSEINNRWVKACCRVGEVEDFTERQGLLLDVIEQKLFPSCRQYNESEIDEHISRYDFNAKLVFHGKL